MVDENFAHITLEDGTQFQVLQFEVDEETGEEVPVDWDEEATVESIPDNVMTQKRSRKTKASSE